MHPFRTEASDSPPQTFLRDGDSVVEINRTASPRQRAQPSDHCDRGADFVYDSRRAF